MQQVDNSFSKRCTLLAPKLIKALESRKFQAYYCVNAKEAAEKALSLIPSGSTVSWGGSITLKEIGLIDLVYQKGYTVFDRDQAKNIDERFDLMRKALLSDVYLTSINSISEDGILINIDSVGNRTAAITFGPKSVIAIVGMNKVCKTADDAEVRARNYTAPLNAVRLLLEKTPCTSNGSCADCKTDECICSTIVKTRMCKIAGRIKVILVGEYLGY
ncbi:MAG: lactate utilization protein [Helicobacteraceae bacterium]|jgi:L-lactate utilization protein LutB|nr:lactate utilization protein [Helicobacteraceae bacterium]